jgi:hypothetical protein
MNDRYPRGRWDPPPERWPPGRSDDAWNQSGHVPYWDNPASRLPHFSYRRPQRPRAIQIAVVLMCVAAGLGLINLIGGPIFMSGIGFGFAPGSVLYVALWLWMASANRTGKGWARIVVTVLFAIDTLGAAWGWWDVLAIAGAHRHLGSGFGGPLSTAVQLDMLSALGVWVLHLAIILLLWRRESSAYYAAVAAGL